MKNKDKKIKTLLKNMQCVQLNSREKAVMKKNIFASTSVDSGVKFNFIKLRYIPIAVSALVLVLLINATEKSLPGDMLYSVKGATEQIKMALTLDPENKAKIESHLANKRLDEAAELLANGELDEEKKNQISSDFEIHTANMKSNIETAKKRGNAKEAEKINLDFTSSINSRADLLEKLNIKPHKEKASSLVEINSNKEQKVEKENGENDEKESTNKKDQVNPATIKQTKKENDAKDNKIEEGEKLKNKASNSNKETNKKSSDSINIQADIDSALDNKLDTSETLQKNKDNKPAVIKKEEGKKGNAKDKKKEKMNLF